MVRLNTRIKLQSGRGARTLFELLSEFSDKLSGDPAKFEFDPKSLSTSEEVDVSKLRLPASAGVDTSALSPSDRQLVFANVDARVSAPSHEPLSVPCYRVPPSQETLPMQRLLESGMAVPFDEADFPVGPDGAMLLNGLFAVKHPKGQRAIFDLRPAGKR